MKKALKLFLCALLILSVFVGAALADGWPSTPVTLTVSAGAGGGTDICARIMLEKLADYGSFTVQNDIDDGGAVGWERVKNVDPKICSELIFYNTGLYVSYLTGLTDIHPIDDLVPVCCMPSGAAQYICVPKDSPFETINDLVTYALENPGRLHCGVEFGSLSHIYVGLAAKSLGIEWSYLSTGSDNDRIQLLMDNSIDVTTINQATAQKYFESGDIKVLVNEHNRSELMSEKMKSVPTMIEAGYRNLETTTELIVWAPAGASDEVYETMFDVFRTVIEDPSIQTELAAGGSDYHCPFASWKECIAHCRTNFRIIEETCREMGLIA